MLIEDLIIKFWFDHPSINALNDSVKIILSSHSGYALAIVLVDNLDGRASAPLFVHVVEEGPAEHE